MGMDITATLVFGVPIDFDEKVPEYFRNMWEDSDCPEDNFDESFGNENIYRMYVVGTCDSGYYIFGLTSTEANYWWADTDTSREIHKPSDRELVEFNKWLKEHGVEEEPTYHLFATYLY